MNRAVKGNLVDSWREIDIVDIVGEILPVYGFPHAEMVYFDISLQSKFTYRQGNVS